MERKIRVKKETYYCKERVIESQIFDVDKLTEAQDQYEIFISEVMNSCFYLAHEDEFELNENFDPKAIESIWSVKTGNEYAIVSLEFILK